MAWTPRDVKDMVVQHPNRFKLISLGGDLYEITPEPGVVTEPGQMINRAYLMPIERKLGMASPWRLLQEYKTAGTYTWTAPDMYGDGQSYSIGVYIIGGGGGGTYSSSSAAPGGASGFARNLVITVTPGQSIPIVIGAGGNNSSGGGSSAFNGVVVNGGKAGNSDIIMSEAGGQPADRGSQDKPLIKQIAPAMGQVAHAITNYGSNAYTGGGEFLNIFNGILYLGAGGSLALGSGGAVYTSQTAPVLPDGLKAGDANGTGAGQNATSPGSGGGAGKTAGGKGAPGAVFIYV